ncbi:EAL domain-containing protein [Achromobacter pestifer]|uniref:Phytochrome-like protein cph2 n=1 Tax=Achromobacter pestifer TaxID=1353889 RepID=A0A6S7BHP0_9BURK|nr:EAL domain-containing protein [Achromobacter pestifer]CAB3714623.1 Phytochrome-like protein cph2 [Achromobacter pestifer]
MAGQAEIEKIGQIGERGVIDMLRDPSQFQLVFQPQINLATGGIESAEALSRWQHPAWGPVPTCRLIQVISNLRLQSALFQRVTELVLEASKVLSKAGTPLPLAINACATTLATPDNPDFLHDEALRQGVELSLVKIELTEDAPVADLRALKTSLACLKRWGCEISMDDFGAGYANLGMLINLTIDELKLDKAFASSVATSRVARRSVRFALALAREMGWRVIAEGISCAAELHMMRALGCRHGQGFHLGRPMELGQLINRARIPGR